MYWLLLSLICISAYWCGVSVDRKLKEKHHDIHEWPFTNKFFAKVSGLAQEPKILIPVALIVLQYNF